MSTNTLVTIRRGALEDVPAITDIYNEAIPTTAATFDIDPKTVEERTTWFQAHDDRHPVLAAVADSKVVGWASFGIALFIISLATVNWILSRVR
jgi:phosphinothricin acetyltransferase